MARDILDELEDEAGGLTGDADPGGPAPITSRERTAEGRWAEQQRAARKQKWLWRLMGYAGFILFWEFLSNFMVAQYILPTPQTVLKAVWQIIVSGEFVRNFGATLITIAIGYSIAFVIGTIIAILMGRYQWWEGYFGNWVTASMNTPGLVFALVCAIIFGLGSEGPLVAVVITTFSFVTVNIAEGVKHVPNELIRMGRAFDVSGRKVQKDIMIPFLAPYFFTALRYGFSTAWKIATLTEVIVGTKGIGFMMRREFQNFNLAGYLAWVFLFFAFALFLERFVLQRQIDRFFRWRPEVSK
jgi:NitT/TauT family transport system permease protein